MGTFQKLHTRSLGCLGLDSNSFVGGVASTSTSGSQQLGAKFNSPSLVRNLQCKIGIAEHSSSPVLGVEV